MFSVLSRHYFSKKIPAPVIPGILIRLEKQVLQPVRSDNGGWQPQKPSSPAFASDHRKSRNQSRRTPDFTKLIKTSKTQQLSKLTRTT